MVYGWSSFAFKKMDYRSFISCCFVLWLTTRGAEGKPAVLVKLENGGEAVCLDGSPPGYYYIKGSGLDINKWIIHMEGGGWCYDEQECLERSKTRFGSSKSWPPVIIDIDQLVGGILSDSSTVNPDFCNWNKIFINYCDGASFTGNVNHPVTVNGTSIYFRGIKILTAIIDHLLSNGMDSAESVILTGCSAGGLGTYLHADYVRTLLPKTIHQYHAMADAGYFVNAPNVDGKYQGREWAQYVFKMQNSSGGVNQKCIDSKSPDELWQCIGANYTYPFITTPIFALNSQYDTWQIENILQLKCHPPNCTDEQMEQLNKFHKEFLLAARPIIDSQNNGAFLDSCFIHCQSLSDKWWSDVKVGGQTAAETFGSWYLERTENSFKEIDCSYPCNKC